MRMFLDAGWNTSQKQILGALKVDFLLTKAVVTEGGKKHTICLSDFISGRSNLAFFANAH